MTTQTESENRLPTWEPTGERNGYTVRERRIGTYHHDEPDREFDEPQEVAAWYRRGIFPAGDYPIVEVDCAPGWKETLIRFTGGVVTAASFVSLFGGVPIGAQDSGPDEVGKPFSHAIPITSFGLGEIITSKDPRYTFHPGIAVRNKGTHSHNGRPMLQAYDPTTDQCIGRW